MKHTILLVDDEESIRRLLLIYLEQHNFTKYIFYSAENGKEAIKCYKKYKPELVVMDLRMPVMDGVEATKQIIEYDSEASIVVFTAYSQTEMEQDALTAGAKGIISKSTPWKGTAQKIVDILGGEK